MADNNKESELRNRIEYYKEKLGDYLRPYSLQFEEFVDDQKIVEVGDKLIQHGLSGGYNFSPHGQFPIGQDEPLITYSIYAQRTDHLATVLSRMEQEVSGFNESLVTFGVRGSKIRGDYQDAELVRKNITMVDGSIETTLESVDCTLVFHPQSMLQAVRMVDFLTTEASKIKGGYEDPDVRVNATEEFKDVFIKAGTLKLGVANLLQFKKGNLIALRQESRFARTERESWKNFDNLLHSKLFEYLVVSDKKVEVKP